MCTLKTDADRESMQKSQTFRIKTLNKSGVEGNFLKLTKGIYVKSIASYFLHKEQDKDDTCSHPTTQHCEDLTRAIRENTHIEKRY